MSTNKKTRPDTAIPEREKMGAETGQDTTSTNDSTTATDCRQIRIADLLLKGEENALPLRHIKQMVNLPGREIRKQIQLERLQHIPILANNKSGYYLAGNDRERERFVRSMKRRAAEIVKVADAVEKAVIG